MRDGKTRLILASGSFVGVFALATSAAFVDYANLNLGGNGIGNPYKFDIALVEEVGVSKKVRQADSDTGFDWVIEGAETLVPGKTITTSIQIFNNTPNLLADTTFAVKLRNGDGSIGNAPNITQFLSFSASVDGTDVFKNKPWDEAEGSVGALKARGTEPLGEGDDYIAGEDGSSKVVSLSILYQDELETVNFNGGQSALSLHFEASSTT